MVIYNNGKQIANIIGGSKLTLDEALDLVMPETWRDEVNANGYFELNGEEVYYDDITADWTVD